jgi:predicted nucleic acid-binding protein
MIFLDTGVFLARFVSRDHLHRAAKRAWKQLEPMEWRCYTSNFVLDETFAMLGRLTTHEFTAERARNLLTSRALTILRPDQEDELRALDLFEKFSDQRVSYSDCISFVLMSRWGIRRVFSFDRRFEEAGFAVWPE